MGKNALTQFYATAVLKEYPPALNHALADCLAVWLPRAEVQQRLSGLGEDSFPADLDEDLRSFQVAAERGWQSECGPDFAE